MSRKQILGFDFSNVVKSNYSENVQHVYLTVRYFHVIDPAQHLLEASRYNDNSLENAKRQVRRCEQISLKGWLDAFGYDNKVSFELQGSIDDGQWYACTLDRVKFRETPIRLISKFYKEFDKVGHEPLVKALVLALKKLKAVEVAFDKEGDFFHVLQSPSDFVKKQFEEKQEDAQVVVL